MSQPVKIIRIGKSLGLIIPVSVCRELSIHRGDYFDLVIGDKNTMVAQRIKIVAQGEFGEGRDSSLPVIKQNE